MQLNLFAAFQLWRTYRWLVLQKLPMIRWSLEKKFSNNSYRPPDDHIKKILETSSQNYRWSNDHFSVFLLNSTNDPTITFLFFCRTLPMIRRSQSGFFAKHYRWSDDHKSVLLMIRRSLPTIRRPSLTDDPTIIIMIDLPMIRRSSLPALLYRWSDDHKILFSAKILPMIRRSKEKLLLVIIGSSVKRFYNLDIYIYIYSCHNWNPAYLYHLINFCHLY